jgi:hypothetical protein
MATEAELIINKISGQNHLPPEVPALSVWNIPIDKAARKERIFAMVFPTLYLTRQADLNVPWL